MGKLRVATKGRERQRDGPFVNTAPPPVRCAPTVEVTAGAALRREASHDIADMPATSAHKFFAESHASVEICLNRESAAALLDLSANRVSGRVSMNWRRNAMKARSHAAERSEDEALIWADHFPGLLQAKARHFLRTHAAM